MLLNEDASITYDAVSAFLQVNTTNSYDNKEEGVAYVKDLLQNLPSDSRWTMTITQDGYEDFSVHFVTDM